jgi:hypothetical protein
LTQFVRVPFVSSDGFLSGGQARFGLPHENYFVLKIFYPVTSCGGLFFFKASIQNGTGFCPFRFFDIKTRRAKGY